MSESYPTPGSPAPVDPRALTPWSELRAEVSTWLDDFRIPDDVPKELRGAIVPPGDVPGAIGRVPVRTLHTLLVRSAAESIVLIFQRPEDPATGWRLAEANEWSVSDDAVVETDLGRRLAMVEHFGAAVAVQPLSLTPAELGLVRWLALLAPGLRVIPLAAGNAALDPDEPVWSGSEFGARLGRHLADDNVAVISVSTLTRYGTAHSFVPSGVGPSAEAWFEQNDDRLLQRVRALDAEGVLTEARAQHNVASPAAVAAAVASARPREGWSGHVVEYTHHHREIGEPVFTASIGYAGIVF
ncbi:MAG: hypothetical protein AAF488_13095 [Planctomycetota bacterium]